MQQLTTGDKRSNGQEVLTTTPWLPLTDYGNAERLMHWHGKDIRHVRKWGKWLIWNGRFWEVDETGEIIRRAKGVVRQMLIDAAGIDQDGVRNALKNWQTKSESHGGITAMIKQTETEVGVPVDPVRLDSDPYLFCVENGVIDLRTGEFRKHQRGDLITKCAPVKYDPKAECPTYRQFIARAFPSESLLVFLNRAIGYSLTADVSEHCLFFLYGSGRNGKSTLLNLIQSIMGPYAKKGAEGLIVQRKNEEHPTNIADLIGCRIAYWSEIDEGKHLAESVVKQLTSEEPLKARYMRQDFFEFPPTHKPWLAANHKPIIRGMDLGIWRRIKLIPCESTIAPSEVDPKLGKKLWAERSGILNDWLIGVQEWREFGLGEPAEVTEAVDRYKNEMDALGEWLTDNCTIGEYGFQSTKELYDNYKLFSESNNDRPISKKTFGTKLADRKFFAGRTVKGERGWSGLCLTSSIPLSMEFGKS